MSLSLILPSGKTGPRLGKGLLSDSPRGYWEWPSVKPDFYGSHPHWRYVKQWQRTCGEHSCNIHTLCKHESEKGKPVRLIRTCCFHWCIDRICRNALTGAFAIIICSLINNLDIEFAAILIYYYYNNHYKNNVCINTLEQYFINTYDIMCCLQS